MLVHLSAVQFFQQVDCDRTAMCTPRAKSFKNEAHGFDVGYEFHS